MTEINASETHAELNVKDEEECGRRVAPAISIDVQIVTSHSLWIFALLF